MFINTYNNKNVLITGHTGFKGSWLTHWLLDLGANVSGYALDPKDDQPLYDQLNLSEQLKYDFRHDINSFAKIYEAIKKTQPSFIFHLAAQPLVRYSYENPIETFSTNVIGTSNLLEAVRKSGLECTIVVVTTDKCYSNNEWIYGYRENEKLGGKDPYSASKAAAEIIVDSYRKSFFQNGKSKVNIASARAGNVIGGGDWSKDRIIPDFIKSILSRNTLEIRNPNATRPWQHVLEPLSGYLWLGACLAFPNLKRDVNSKYFSSGFNFGPEIKSNKTVRELIEDLILFFPNARWEKRIENDAPYEASKLNLAIDKAYHLLGWYPVWDFDKTIEITAKWYTSYLDKDNLSKITSKQIKEYCTMAKAKGLIWAKK